MRASIQLRGFSLRRNSLPTELVHMRPVEVPPLRSTESINNSLNLFYLRNNAVLEILNDDNAEKFAKLPRIKRRKKMSKLLSYAHCNPRLPIEMNVMLIDRSRRRTIAEPERLERELHLMFEMRNNLSALRNRARKVEGMPIRRYH